MNVKEPATEAQESVGVPNGSAWAALLSAGIGCSVFGILTVLSESRADLSNALDWYHPSGALSGVAICSVLIWLIAWAILRARWKGRHLPDERTLMVRTIVLVFVGILTTFPPFYELFKKGG